MTYVFFRIFNDVSPLRVSVEAEHIGLNVSEHNAHNDLFDLDALEEAIDERGKAWLIGAESGDAERIGRRLLMIAKLYTYLKQASIAVELYAFLLNDDDMPEAIQDDAERLIFQLESDVGSAITQSAWEIGKAYTLADVIERLSSAV